MKHHVIAIAIALAGITGGATAGQPSAANPGAALATAFGANLNAQVVWGPAAGRIVGAYQSDADVRKCGTTFPLIHVTNNIIFNAGGTITESARFPPVGDYNVFGIPGLFTRNVGLGTWSYNPFTHRYSMSLRYDYFVDGVYYGMGTVDRDLVLSADGKLASGPVKSSIYTTTGSTIVDLCGDAVSKRL
jgi:hypothetical protein